MVLSSLLVGHALVLLASATTPDFRRCTYCGVQSLSADPDYRSVKLSWKYVQSQEPPAFRVKYCEVSEWQRKPRCRQRILPLSRAIHPKGKWNQKELPPDQLLGKLIRLEKGSYQTSITDLRMITNYTFTVDADFHGFPYNVPVTGSSPYSPTSSEQFLVSAETRGFSGKTLRCLGNASEVAVNTGPYFNGKISVEGASDESCSLYGNQSSAAQIYTMTINHILCGSKINNNMSVETMIIVHENREILTHNSRRFLVVCNFPTETYTFTASADVPPHLLRKKKKNQHETESLPKSSPGQDRAGSRVPHQPVPSEDPNHISIFDKYKFNHVRDSRILLTSDSAAQTSHHIFHRSVTDARYDALDVGSAAAALVTGLGLLFYAGRRRRQQEKQSSETHSPTLGSR